MNLRVTPDGRRYLAMARGKRQPLPFHLRWLMPALCGQNEVRWFALNTLATCALPLLVAVLAVQHGATQTQAAVAALLFAGLPFVRFAWNAPILVDMPALALALGAALCWPHAPLVALVLVAFAAMICEKTPILAAVFAMEPVLLAGLAVPALRYLVVPAGEVDPQDQLAWTFKPISASQRAHAGLWREPRLMLLPWGACLIVFLAPSLWLGLALAAGYGQVLLATDTVRLYQQAAPVVCVAAALMIPEQWIAPVLLAHWFNPWMGNGL